MSVDFTPNQNSYKDLTSFRFWCQKVLPAVYDDSLSYYELLNKVVNYLNDIIHNVDAMSENITTLYQAYVNLQGWVNHYFDNIDVQLEINNKLDMMANDGSLDAILNRVVKPFEDGVNTTVGNMEDKIVVLQSRMDIFTALPNGSTAGDAEIADARVGLMGEIYPNVGQAIRDQLAERYYIFPEIIFATNYSQFLPDVNTAKSNTIYNIQCSGSIPLNLPIDYPTNGSEHLLIDTHLRLSDLFDTPIRKQVIFDYKTLTLRWARESVPSNDNIVTWGKWCSIKNGRSIITVGAGGTHSKLIDALSTAYRWGNTDVILLPGVYDIISEYGDTIANAGCGPVVGNNTRLICSPNSFVKCNYNGGDPNVETLFSPINAGVGDFEIDGLRIECSKVRYAIHDELSGRDGRCKHIYRNCDITINNRGSSWLSPQCIGGGLGAETDILIENCLFESVRTDNPDYLEAVSYHNSYTNHGSSSIVISNSYFRGEGTAKFGYLGTSPSKTIIKVSGCKLGQEPVLIPENTDAQVNNMIMFSWNNIINQDY